MIPPEWFEIAPQSPAYEKNLLPADKILLSGTVLSEEFLGSKSRFVIQSDSSSGKEIITEDFDTISCENVRIGDRIILAARKFWEMAGE